MPDHKISVRVLRLVYVMSFVLEFICFPPIEKKLLVGKVVLHVRVAVQSIFHVISRVGSWQEFFAISILKTIEDGLLCTPQQCNESYCRYKLESKQQNFNNWEEGIKKILGI